MKRIQAQRKFAQGAPIPSNNFTNSERRVDVTPVKEETRNIVHNNTPAKTFLDFISFNQIHEHRVPVVLLERLKTNPTNPFIINQKIEELEGTVEPKITTNLRSHISIENKIEENRMEVDDPVVIQKITNVLIQTSTFENGSDIEDEEPINSNRISGPKTTQKTSLNPAVKTISCNISDASVDEDMMPLASYAVKKKRLILNKTKRLTFDENRKHKILKKSELPSRLIKKRSCRGRKRVNLGSSDDSTRQDDSNTIIRKKTPANKKDNFLNQSSAQANTSLERNFLKENLRNRHRVVKKVLVEPSTRRLRNQNGSVVKSEHQLRDLKLSSNKHDKPIKKPTRIERKNKDCKSVNQRSKYLYEMCSSNKNKRTKFVPKIENVHFKGIPRADSSPNTYIPAPSSNQKNHTSSGPSQNSTTISEIFEASEADDSSESSHHKLVSKNEDVIFKDASSADNSRSTSTPALSSSQGNDTTSPGPSQTCTTLSEMFEASDADDSSESCHHKLMFKINDDVFKDTPSADSSPSTSTPAPSSSQNNHTTSPVPSENCTTLSEILEVSEGDDSSESCHHKPHAKIKNVGFKDTSSVNSSSNTSTLAPNSSQRNHTSPGPSENFTTLREIFEASDVDDSAGSCDQCKDMENIMKLQDLADKTSKNPINSSNSSHRDKDALNSGETSNLWKEQCSFDLNLLRKNMLRMKYCTHTKSKKTKPVVACSLVSKPFNSGNAGETQFPKDVQAENGMSVINNNNIIIDVTETLSKSLPISETSRPCSNTENNCKTRSKTSTSLTNAKRVPLLAPVFTPTAAEFSDPVAYLDSITPKAKEFGICKVVPPANFLPTCNVNDKMVFNATNQYIARLFSRWGPGSKEMSTIKAYLASQSVVFKRAPLYEGMEVNLPKLYQLVQRHGGLKEVIERKRWSRVAEEMHFTKRPNPEKKLDQLYVKYLLPYDTLSSSERSQIMSKVERGWSKKYRKMIQRAFDPLHRQNRLLNGCESSEEDDEDSDDDEYITGALAEAEECVVPGRKMNLATFRKVATTALDTFFSSTSYPTPVEVEQEYWRLVLHGTDHVCVNSASIDTGSAGYGFTNKKSDEYGDHPWNLKMLANNNNNILRFLGQVLGVTVPTLHLGMVFSTSCWHRDPHSLPWMEYMHSGPPKIWYGIPDGQSKQFRKAVESLCPTSCLNKSMWLPSDITMIPPELLLEHDVSLSRVEQNPGEYIFVFPKAYSSSISTGLTISESVYFASISWLQKGLKCFSEAQISCEPTMISVESLLIAVVTSQQQSLDALLPALSMLSCLLLAELQNRKTIVEEMAAYPRSTRFLKHRRGPWNVRDQDECEVCRKTLFISRIRGLTKNNTSLCLEHAIQIIKKMESKNLPVPPFEVDYYFYTEEIDNILTLGRKRFRELQAEETFIIK